MIGSINILKRRKYCVIIDRLEAYYDNERVDTHQFA